MLITIAKFYFPIILHLYRRLVGRRFNTIKVIPVKAEKSLSEDKVNTYHLGFYGRNTGALGVTFLRYKEVKSTCFDAAVVSLYESFELISHIKELKPHEIERVRSRAKALELASGKEFDQMLRDGWHW
jgi:hypothetical protein